VGFPGAWKRTGSLPSRTAEANLQANLHPCGFRKRQAQADDQPDAGLASPPLQCLSPQAERGILNGEKAANGYASRKLPCRCFSHFFRFYNKLVCNHPSASPFAPHYIPHRKTKNRKRLTFAATRLILKIR
jgi:hypothetical protein